MALESVSSNLFVLGYDVELCSKYCNRIALNQDQLVIIRKIVADRYESGGSRTAAFMAANPGLIGKAFVPTGAEVANLAAFGIIVAVHTVMNPITFMIAYAAVTEGGALTLGIPVAVGLLAWYGVVTYQKLSAIKNSLFYQNWLDIRNQILKNQSFKSLIMSTPGLALFTCSLSGCLPAIAVREKGTSRVYDFETFQAWILQHPEACAEVSGAPYCLNDVEFDFPHMQSMVDRLYNLMDKVETHFFPEVYDHLKAVDIFFTLYGKEREPFLPIRKICFEYLGNEIPAAFVGSSGQTFLVHLSTIIKNSLEIIIKEKKALENRYREEYAKSTLSPTDKMRGIVQLFSDQRKVVSHREVPYKGWIFYGTRREPFLETIDLKDSERMVGLEDYPGRPPLDRSLIEEKKEEKQEEKE